MIKKTNRKNFVVPREEMFYLLGSVGFLGATIILLLTKLLGTNGLDLNLIIFSILSFAFVFNFCNRCFWSRK